jgi:hypothetical protein
VLRFTSNRFANMLDGSNCRRPPAGRESRDSEQLPIDEIEHTRVALRVELTREDVIRVSELVDPIRAEECDAGRLPDDVPKVIVDQLLAKRRVGEDRLEEELIRDVDPVEEANVPRVRAYEILHELYGT